jgi:D-glycero-alpha-D-manno-heptose-7-phosphate kinase
VGSQDQVAAAHGGLNKIEFLPAGEIIVTPLIISQEKKEYLRKHLMLFFTGFTRMAAMIEKNKVRNFVRREQELTAMAALVDAAMDALQTERFDDFGKLLGDSWQLKQSLAEGVTTDVIDSIYEEALRAGALGGKILGAGGGGFLLLFAPPERHPMIREKLDRLLEIPFDFEPSGSQIIFYKPDMFPRAHA